MPTDTDLASTAATALADDGDTFDLPDGRTLRLRVEPDQDSGGWNDQMDPECFGVVEWVRGQNRPSSFDGAARKILTDGSETLWWQPPTAKAIGTVWTPEQWREQTAYVVERCEFGWVVATVELVEEVADSRGGVHRVVVARASLCGMDEVYPEAVADLVAEVLP